MPANSDPVITNPPIHQPCLIVLCGPPGSGKSEWARRNRQGVVVIGQDEVIDCMTPDGFDHAFRPVYAAAERAAARAGLTAGFTVIIDRTNRTRALREIWIQIAREANAPAVAVEMGAGPDLCRERNRARTGPRRVSEERMERMLASMQQVSSDEGFAAVFRDDEIALTDILEHPKLRVAKEAGEHSPGVFSTVERRGLYRAIYERRDVRSEFVPQPVPDAVLGRILDAAHHAPSVGFMQPWDFIIIRDEEVRRKVYENFEGANREAARMYDGSRHTLYDALKLQGILHAPVNICVTCDRQRAKGHGLGRQSNPETDLYSTVCAVQNLWLAARAESLGVGWVSILDFEQLKAVLHIPAGVTPVAYLCIGYVSEFRRKPELEEKGWECRENLARLIHFDQWGRHDQTKARDLFDGLGKIDIS